MGTTYAPSRESLNGFSSSGRWTRRSLNGSGSPPFRKGWQSRTLSGSQGFAGGLNGTSRSSKTSWVLTTTKGEAGEASIITAPYASPPMLSWRPSELDFSPSACCLPPHRSPTQGFPSAQVLFTSDLNATIRLRSPRSNGVRLELSYHASPCALGADTEKPVRLRYSSTKTNRLRS